MAWHQGLRNPIPEFSLHLQDPQRDRNRGSNSNKTPHKLTWGQIKALSAQSSQLLEKEGVPNTPENFLVAAFSCLNANSIAIVCCIVLCCIFPITHAIPEQGLWDQNVFVKDVQNFSVMLNKTDCWIRMYIPPQATEGLMIPLKLLDLLNKN